MIIFVQEVSILPTWAIISAYEGEAISRNPMTSTIYHYSYGFHMSM